MSKPLIPAAGAIGSHPVPGWSIGKPGSGICKGAKRRDRA
jgi:hypothetical protein